MNADLLTVLFLLCGIGIFLAIVVGRLQIAQYEELERDVADQLKAVRDLEADYQSLSEMTAQMTSGDRIEILPLLSGREDGKMSGEHTEYAVAGRIARRSLVLYEAFEHVDDSEYGEDSLRKALAELGLSRQEPNLDDFKSMLRVAREAIHSRRDSSTAEQFDERLSRLDDENKLSLSDNGKLRLREFLNFMHRPDMRALREDFLDYLPVIEERMLNK